MPTINYDLNDEDMNNELNNYAKNQFDEFLKSHNVTFDPKTMQWEELNKGSSMIYFGYKMNTDVKENFKVDKLGWYELEDSKDNDKLHGECVYIDKKINECCIKHGIHLYNFNLYGLCLNEEAEILRVIKYLGPELPKEPRVFEFEAETIERQSENRIGLMSLIVGHYCTPFAEIGSFSKEEMNEYNLISKWKVKMEEVLE